MAKSANLTSTEAVSALRETLLQFAEEAQHALTALQIEAQRPIEWIEHDRTLYWPREMRKASDRLAEARLELQRCEMTISGEDRRACIQEKKNLQKAKARLELTEERIRTVRRWKFEMKKAIEEFQVQLARVQRYLENDIPIAAAELLRMIQALEAYTGAFSDRSTSSVIPPTTPTTPPEPSA
jgi:hypothetical protein